MPNSGTKMPLLKLKCRYWNWNAK